MAIQIGDNFSYQGKKYIEERMSFDSISEMASYPETSVPEGFITYVVSENKHYQYNSANSVDATTGKWREYNNGLISLCLSKTGINGEVTPTPFKWHEDLKVKQVILMSNAVDISVAIGENTYNKDTLIDVELPAGTEMTDFDIEITAGSNQGNVIIIFERI